MATDALPTETRDAVESFVDGWVREDGVPGASVAIVDGDDLVYAEGFGARDRGTNAPATPETLYGVGSCTKSVTATAVMQLAEAGDLAVDDPVDDYLPHLAGVPGEPVTLRDLLAHTSGMPSDGNLSALITRLTGRGDGDPDLPMSSDADFRRHVAAAADERLTDRDRFFYYNTGYTLLGTVVEAVSGQAYADYVSGHVHEPLGMDRSLFAEDAFEAEEDRMTPYNFEDGEAVEGSLAFDERLYAPGGMASSVVETSRYLRAFVGDGAFDGSRLLEPASVAEMTEPRATREDYLDGRELGYGYGLSSTSFLGDTLVAHGGMMGTTTAWIGYLDDAGVGAVVACNAAPERHPSVAGKAILALHQGADPGETVPTLMLERKAEPLEGEYASHRGVRTATVERDGGALRIESDDSGWPVDHLVYPESLDPDEHEYFMVTARGKRVPVEFLVDGKGENEDGEGAGDDGSDGDVSLLLQRWRLHRE